MNMKKTLAGVMAVAMTATMLPGSMFAAPEKVEAETVMSSLPAAKYEMDFENGLETKNESSVTATVWYGENIDADREDGRKTEYNGNVQYADGYSGKAFDTTDNYGVVYGNVELDDTYTISVWMNLRSQPGFGSPFLCVAHPGQTNDWLAIAGALNEQAYILWADGQDSSGDLGKAAMTHNQWVNYTLTVDGDTATLYENGTQVIRDTDDAVNTESKIKEIELGVNYWDDVPDCLYDELKIYDEALSAEQVQALYSGTSLSLSASQDYVRVGDTIELTADIIGMQDGDIVEWSPNEFASVDENGVVTGSAEGTATITANVKRGDDVIATDRIDINVIPEKGNLIAEFTFDEEESVFAGAGAVAAKNNPEDSNYVKVVTDDVMGNVLQFNNTAGASEGNWLNVTKANGSSLLADAKEFTVSYDSNSHGESRNCWTFFADNQGGIADDRGYIGILDYPTHLEVEKGTPWGGGLITGDEFSGWKHIDVVFGSDYTDIYIDGNLCASADNTRLVTELLGNDSFVMIGKSTWGNEYWNGMLDNYKIYNYALTAEEVMIEYRDLQHHPAVEATCTTDGNVEYWTDADGNYYLDAAGETLTTADGVKVEATGHSYGQPTWEWVQSEDGSTYTAATATFICEKCNDTQQVTDNEITHVIENGQVTHSAEVTFDEQSYKTTITVDLVLTAREKVPATCTEAGTKAYWTDQFGNRYSDAEGKIPITGDKELVIPATGHDYIASGRWVAREDGYSLDVTFTCKHGDDTATVPANVTSSPSEGVTVYTAVAEYNGTEFTFTKAVQDNYTLTVENGKIQGTDQLSSNYGYKDVVTVVADAEKDGQNFAGWYIGETLVSTNTTYTFCITEDKTLTAKYADEELEATAVVSLRMSEREDAGSSKEKVIMTVEWSMPSDYYMVDAGIIRSYTEDDVNLLKLGNVDGSTIRKNATTLSCREGSLKYTLTMSATTKLNPINAVGYLVYRDAEGQEHTKYTELCISPVTN